MVRRNARHPALSLLAAGALLAPPLSAQAPAPSTGYRNHAALTTAIDALRRDHPRLVTVEVIATSPGGRAVHAVRLGMGANVDRRPALLIMANAYGPHVVGSEIALGTMQRLATAYGRDAEVTALLDRTTFYVIPRLNPDAAEAFFRRPLHERTLNELADDQDHDGQQDEDGPDDLNGDGFIAMMRIADPAGDWRPDPTDPWLMRRADAVKGETGGWRIIVEARDSDGDGEIGEDPPGGVDINKNFAHDYAFFGEGSGVHQFSSPEARAVAEFVYRNNNIAAAYVLGPQDNLMEPWRHRPQTGGPPQGTSAGGPLQSILRADEGWFGEMSERFKRTSGLTRNPPSVAIGGDPASWMYYHMGRFSFASRGWWVPEAARDTAAAPARPAAGGAAGQGADPVAYERNAMKWLQATDPTAVLPWTAIQHPDFPGQVVEVGGFRPFALWNPPAALLDSVITKQHRFITELAGMLPSIELRGVTAEPLGQGAWRITAQVANLGYLPTMTALGPRARWPRQIRVDLKTGQGQTLVSGRAMQLLGPIQGSGRSTELSWVVTGSRGSTIELSAESPVAGAASTTITLR
jgi:hypothetical protein